MAMHANTIGLDSTEITGTTAPVITILSTMLDGTAIAWERTESAEWRNSSVTSRR